jgi:hypothetical protein
MDLFFVAVAKQADDRVKGHVPDLESFIAMRRDTSCCKPAFALIEYAACIDLPDEVVSHPVIVAMEEATNDLVTWSNVIPHSAIRNRGSADIVADRILSPITWSNLAMTRIT